MFTFPSKAEKLHHVNKNIIKLTTDYCNYYCNISDDRKKLISMEKESSNVFRIPVKKEVKQSDSEFFKIERYLRIHEIML